MDYGCKSSELGNVKFRRSLYFAKSLKAGDIITPDSIRSVRPGFGVPPKFLDRIIGTRISHDTNANTPVTPDILETF
ncbi:Pseudaminic acid synthase [compost metagenome]